ncbi:MAG: nucleoside triphosphate pyrophosphohydrolase [Gammaproteobacteria bacterium]|nr:nucleoside triphosphate pyrophosphohydrolase [Gammaproteobacteria bacterium]
MSSIEKLLEIMVALRDPQAGCPWDQQQDFSSIAPYTIEEAYEVADAIAREDLPGLRDELGDLLFQVVFHARMAEEIGAFDFAAVAAGICDKMLRRHPHVFGDAEQRAAGPVAGSWERIKSEERARSAATVATASAVDGIAVALPALKRAQKLGKRAAAAGFDWPDSAGPRAKIDEEIAELEEACEGGDAAAISEEFGDLLFACVNLARHLEIDAEQALAAANRKFEARFRDMEERIRASGRDPVTLDLESLEAEWQRSK